MFREGRKFKVIIFTSLIFSAAFAIFGGFSYGYSLKNEIYLLLAGAIIGLIAAPEIEPKLFKYPALWQVTFSIIGFIILAYSLSSSLTGYGLAVIAGIVIGWLAPYWVKHINAP